MLEGRVAVNGVVTRELATLADPSRDVITVDGRVLPAAEPKRYVLLHKPRGYVTTRHDPAGRPIVTELVSGPERLYPVGRLDADVEGLLLLTNDGPLTHRLLHPRYGVPRRYEAEVEGRVAVPDLARWRRGAVLDDGPARPMAVELVRSGPTASHLELTSSSGRASRRRAARARDAFARPVARAEPCGALRTPRCDRGAGAETRSLTTPHVGPACRHGGLPL